MATGLAGFIEYDSMGRPFMGFLIEDGNVQVKLYLAHKEGATQTARTIGEQLAKMAKELQGLDEKIVPVGAGLSDFLKGDGNASVRQRTGKPGQRPR